METKLPELQAAPCAEHLPESLLRWLIQKKAPSPSDLPALLKDVALVLPEDLQAQAAAVYLSLPNQRMQLQAFSFAAHKLTAPVQPFERIIIAASDATPAGKAVLHGNPVRLTNASQAELARHPLRTHEFQIRNVLAIPLKIERAVGCIEILNKEVRGRPDAEFTPQDIQRGTDVAYFVTRAVQRCESTPLVLPERDRAVCLAGLAGCAFIDLDDHYQLDPALLTLMGADPLKRYRVLPLAKIGERSLKAAVANPFEYQSIGDFEVVTGFKIAEKVVATESRIRGAIEKMFSHAGALQRETESVLKDLSIEESGPVELSEQETEDSGPIIKLANRIIEDAHAQGASDIHVEPYENRVVVRYRVDGVCRKKFEFPQNIHRPLISRLKIMSELDIAERRLPQDGRIVFQRYSSALDIHLRVSTAPTAQGEAMVLRLLDRTKSTLPLDQLGFSAYNIERYRKVIQSPYGMILHVGPTGSGKSMTLFAALNEINSPEWKILTAEDPVEYTLDGISQVQVKEDIGLTFASVLRCFLRQDPDIILVGEIRDGETAQIAIEAALTGHLLFSTLHTNDAPSTVSRLVDLKIDPFLIASSIQCVCAQRLLRRLCPCRKEQAPSGEELAVIQTAKLPQIPSKIGAPRGCDTCDHTGYKGRIGIHELMLVGDQLRDMIGKGAPTQELRKMARSSGMVTLFEDAIAKVASGITSLREAIATARPDE